jgi:Zn-dependent oligopeptidase
MLVDGTEAVLKLGGSRKPMELLKKFLGREPSIEAFYEELDIA